MQHCSTKAPDRNDRNDWDSESSSLYIRVAALESKIKIVLIFIFTLLFAGIYSDSCSKSGFLNESDLYKLEVKLLQKIEHEYAQSFASANELNEKIRKFDLKLLQYSARLNAMNEKINEFDVSVVQFSKMIRNLDEQIHDIKLDIYETSEKKQDDVAALVTESKPLSPNEMHLRQESYLLDPSYNSVHHKHGKHSHDKKSESKGFSKLVQRKLELVAVEPYHRCDELPILSPNNHLNNFQYDERIDRVLSTVNKISALASLNDFRSAQYKAACWVLFDDHLGISPENIFFIQRYVVALLHFAINKNDKMGIPLDTCSHERVECTKEGYVSSIDMENNQFETTIPSELAHLRELESLYLSNSGLIGTIPTEVGILSKLKTLDLSNNLLSGFIPSELGMLQKLSVLRLGSNKITGSIPSKVGGMIDLEEIDLSTNFLGGSIPSQLFDCDKMKNIFLYSNQLIGTIPTNVNQMKNLVKINFDDNHLSGKIPSELGEILPSMDDIRISRNELTGPIPEELGKSNSLSRFVVSNNYLSGTIPNFSGNFSRALVLNLSFNRLHGSLPQSIWKFASKDAFLLDSNDVTGEVPEDFCSKTALIRIDSSQWFLEQPKINCTCCDNINCMIWRSNENIVSGSVRPDCPSNNIVDIDVTEYYYIDDHVANLTFREFVGTGMTVNRSLCLAPTGCYSFHRTREKIFDYNIGYNSRLKSLEKRHECETVQICGRNFDNNHPKRKWLNHLTQMVIPFLPVDPQLPEYRALCWILEEDTLNDELDICDGTLLQRYVLLLFYFSHDLEFNEGFHTCDWPGVTCDGRRKFVQKFDLCCKNITGTINTEIGLISSLQEIHLNNNSLSGNMDSSIFKQMSLLEVFDVSHNELGGEIPKQLFEVENLKKVDISHNNLVGTLPSLENYPRNLEYINVEDNLLMGSIPDGLITCSALSYINLSRNNLIQAIPKEIGSLENLSILMLNENRLMGSIPPEIFKASHISYLMLQSNVLTGTIPTQIGNLAEVREIILSHNFLEGEIPEDFEKLTNLELLQLHSNRLFGNAPQINFVNTSAGNQERYITDCGTPHFLLQAELKCPFCSLCCNSLDACQRNEEPNISTELEGYLFVGTFIPIIIVFLFFTVFMLQKKDSCLINIDRRNLFSVYNEDSVYCLIFSSNYLAWGIYFSIAFIQAFLFSLFMRSSNLHDEDTVRVFTIRCPENDLHCDNEQSSDDIGWVMFGVVTGIFLGSDLVDGILQLRKAVVLNDSRFLLSGMIHLFLTILALYTSTIYNRALAVTNGDLIMNTVILLFINDLDEQFLNVLDNAVPHWVAERYKEIENNLMIKNEVHGLAHEKDAKPRLSRLSSSRFSGLREIQAFDETFPTPNSLETSLDQ